MRKYLFLAILLLTSLTISATVEGDFNKRFDKSPLKKYTKVLKGKLTQDERTYLTFLYAYMPLPDLVDYDGAYWKAQVDASLDARKTMTWGSKVPEREFRHFVLPVRINNENLDNSREVFYKELKDRVNGLSMKDAALEVNHWCHEKVTYSPSDSRTSGPLASVRSAFGRCGEESTFCVAAMRSVGIPARQVYTPRWAHTDDNHAWVEVWVDGEWHFLGACEPEAVLDLGWFNAPASRGLLMHTKVFGNYDGPEEVMSQNNDFTEINVTSNYAPVEKALVKVVDKDGKPVEGAKVEFKIYNYAEFFTAATKYTDANGGTFLSAGKGDLLVWATKDGRFGIGKCTVASGETVTVVLDKTNDFIGGFDIDLVPPAERNTVPYQTEEQIQSNKVRFAKEDSIRGIYVNTFSKDEFMSRTRGNHAVVEAFLKNHPDADAKALLATLSEKDLRDVPADVLEDHYGNHADDGVVLGPRVSNEMLTPYRHALTAKKDLQKFRGNPVGLAKWVSENIKIDTEWNPQMLCMSPVGVYDSKVADTHSRDIFYVAAARSLGIDARMDEVTGKVQWKNGSSDWNDVNFGETVENTTTPSGVLRAAYTPTPAYDNPKYYSHFSISKMVDGEPQLLNYPEDGVTWSSLLKDGTPMDEGNYLVVSGSRMADGSVLAHLEFVPIFNGGTTDMTLVMRESAEGIKVLGNFNSENLYNDDNEGVKSLLSTTGRGYYILGVIAPLQEPTNHALKDISLLKSDFEKWGGKIMLLFRNDADKARFTNKSEFPNLPSTVVWGTDVNGQIEKEIKDAMKLGSDQLPIFIIADTFNRVVFVSQGYTIGLGEQLNNYIKKLEK